MGDARSEVPLAVLQDRQDSTATPQLPADAGSGTGQQEVSSFGLPPPPLPE
jgi:hypothetical protein